MAPIVDVKDLGYFPRQVGQFSRAEFSAKVLEDNNPKPLVVEQPTCQNMRQVQNDFIFPKTNSSVKMKKPLRNHHPGPWTPKLQFWKPDLNSKLVGNFGKMKFPYLNLLLVCNKPCSMQHPQLQNQPALPVALASGERPGLCDIYGVMWNFWRYHIDDLVVAEVKLPWNWNYNLQVVTRGDFWGVLPASKQHGSLTLVVERLQHGTAAIFF